MTDRPATDLADPASAARPTDAELREALDLQAVARLQARYGDVVTRRSWSELDDLFVADAPITLDLRRGDPLQLRGAAALGEMVERAVARFEFFEFALLNSVVDLVGADEATGRLYMCELRQEGATGRWTTAYGLYRDRYVREDGTWRIAERHYSSLARTAPEADGSRDGSVRDFEVYNVPPA